MPDTSPSSRGSDSRSDLADDLRQVGSDLREAAEETVAALKPRLRGVLHQGAFHVALVTGTVLITLAEGTREIVSAVVYAVSVVLLFGTSAGLHRRNWSPRAESVMRRLDHSMIYILIAGTYTPFALLLMDGAARWSVLGIVWGGALFGIALRNAVRSPPRWGFTALYLALGWVALAYLPTIYRAGGGAVLTLLVLGGVLYSVGAVVYATKKPNPFPRWFGFHEVFHALTLAAFAAHYVAVSLVVY